MTIASLSSAPDQAGPTPKHEDLMHLHLSLPAELAAESEWFNADPAVTAVESSNESDGDDDSSGAASTIVGLLPLLLIVVAVYFLLLRPRQRQMRQQRELQSGLEVGDEVMLTSGVYGFITGFESGTEIVWVEIDDDVQIRVSRAAVSGKVDTGGAAATAAAGESAGAGTGSTAPRRPTLKGSSAKSAGTSPAPEEAADEPAENAGHRPDAAE